MASGGEDDQRVRRKFDAPREKPLSLVVAEEQQALVGLTKIGGVMMNIFGKRKLC